MNMRRPSALDPLTNSQLNICTYGGAFGVLLALTCFIQLMIFGLSSWQVPVLLLIYAIAAASSLFLALQKHFAPLLLIISAVLTFIAVLLWTISLAFSFVVILLALYSVLIVVFVYVEQIPAQLKQKKQAMDAEKASWQNKI